MSCCGSRSAKPVPSLPSLNVATAQEGARKTMKKPADAALVERRIGICRKCPHQQNDLCHRCGCFLVMKVGGEKEACPLLKW